MKNDSSRQQPILKFMTMSKTYKKEKEPTKLSASSLKKEKFHTESRRKQNKYQLLTDDLTDEELDKISARLGSC